MKDANKFDLQILLNAVVSYKVDKSHDLKVLKLLGFDSDQDRIQKKQEEIDALDRWQTNILDSLKN